MIFFVSINTFLFLLNLLQNFWGKVIRNMCSVCAGEEGGSPGCHANTEAPNPAWAVREGFLLEVMPMLSLRM